MCALCAKLETSTLHFPAYSKFVMTLKEGQAVQEYQAAILGGIHDFQSALLPQEDFFLNLSDKRKKKYPKLR